MSDPHSIGDTPPIAHPRLARVGRFLGFLSNASLYIAGAGLVAMSVIVLWQVFVRFVLNWGQAWTELTSIMIMSWFIFLGAAVGVREKFHMGFDVLLYAVPKAKPVLRSISDLAMFAFASGMVFYGLELAIRGWTVRIPVLGLPQTFTYLPIVVSGVLICLFVAERMALRLAGEPVDADTTEHTVSEA